MNLHELVEELEFEDLVESVSSLDSASTAPNPLDASTTDHPHSDTDHPDVDDSEDAFYRLQESFPEGPTDPTELLTVPDPLKPDSFRQPSLEELLRNAIQHLAVDEPVKAVGLAQLQLFGHYPEQVDDLPGDFDQIETARIYLLANMLENQSEISRGLQYRSEFQNKLNVSGSTSQSTISRLMNSDGLDAFENETQQALTQLSRDFEGTEYEDWLPEPPTPEPDGQGEYPLTLILRDLRKKTYPYIRFNRDKSVTHSKDMLLRVLASAARDYVHLTTAADGLKYKHWLDEDDIPSRWTLGYHLRKVALEGWDEDDEEGEDDADSTGEESDDDEAEDPDEEMRQLGLDEFEDLDDDKMEELEFRNFYEVIDDIRDMFLAANQELHDIIADHGYYDGQHAVAFDTTDVLFRGDPEALGSRGTKATRNASHAWQFISCSLIGTDAPTILMSELVKNSGDKAGFLKRALWMADTMIDVNRAYLDSGFYNEDSARALGEFENLGWVMQAKQKADDIDELMDVAIENELDWNAKDWGVSDIPPRHNLWVMESEKKSKRYKQEPDDPKDKWIAFYTNIDWVADAPDEEIDTESLTEEQREMPLTPLELADDFRARWGVETGYRKLKEDFLAKSRSTRYYIRAQVFYFAVLWYNMWLAANVIRAGKLGLDLGDDDVNYPFSGPHVMRAIEEDPVDLEIGETEDLSVIDDKLDSFDPWSEFR